MIIAEKSAGILENKLNIELSKAENRLSNNKLTLNIKKTMYMIFGNKRKLNRLKELNIQIGTEKIKRTEIYKYLGVYFDSQLSWKEHVKKNVCKSGRKTEKDRESATSSNIPYKGAPYQQPRNVVFQLLQ